MGSILRFAGVFVFCSVGLANGQFALSSGIDPLATEGRFLSTGARAPVSRGFRWQAQS